MNSLRQGTRKVLTRCTCSAQPLRLSSAFSARTFSSSRRRLNADPTPAPSPLPWFVDPSDLPPTPSPSPRQALSVVPLPPPPHLPDFLHPLFAHLSISPFLDRDKITFIHAREADPENSWVEWVVVASLRPGREGGIRGAIEGVRAFLAETPVDISPAPPVTPFSPPSSRPLISGLPTPPSRHARGRKPSPSRAEQASGWAMLDAGNVVVHVMTRDAREHWGIEELWKGVERETAKIGKVV